MCLRCCSWVVEMCRLGLRWEFFPTPRKGESMVLQNTKCKILSANEVLCVQIYLSPFFLERDKQKELTQIRSNLEWLDSRDFNLVSKGTMWQYGSRAFTARAVSSNDRKVTIVTELHFFVRPILWKRNEPVWSEFDKTLGAKMTISLASNDYLGAK